MQHDEIVEDADVVPDDDPTTDPTEETAATSTEVVHRAATGSPPVTVATGVLMPFAADQVRDAMTAYQDAVRATLDRSDWQGRPNTRGAFVKKSGWRKLAKAFGLSVTRVEDGIERDSQGEPIRAWSVYRATAPNGQSQDGDGYCSVDEPRFTRSEGRQKLENDLRATATTRAKNRAIADLVGMGEVSAEEVQVTPEPVDPPFAGDLTPALQTVEGIVGRDATVAFLEWLRTEGGGQVRTAAGRTLIGLTRLIGPELTADEEPPDEGETVESPPIDREPDRPDRDEDLDDGPPPDDSGPEPTSTADDYEDVPF